MKEKKLDKNSADIIEAIQGLTRHMDDRFDGVDTRFQRIDTRFDKIDKRLDRIEFKVTGQAQRIEILEDRVLQLANHIGLSFLK